MSIADKQNRTIPANILGSFHNAELKRLKLRFSQRLLKKNIPTGLQFELKDPWPGHLDKARLLLNNCFDLDGLQLDFKSAPNWHPIGIEGKHYYRLHNFEWLRDLKTLGGEASRQKGRALIAHWISQNRRPQCESWSADIMAMRIYNWLAFYSFFCASAPQDFLNNFFESLSAQIFALSQHSAQKLDDMTQMRIGRALGIAGLTLKEYDFMHEKGMAIFLSGLKEKILLDGGHRSRSPAALVPLLCAAHDMRMCLLSAGKQPPLLLQNSIDRMNNALRFFCYNDRHFALFHSTQIGDAQLVGTLLSLAGNAQKMPKSMPQSGFERISMGRSTLLMDTGKAPNDGHQHFYHASTLAFELNYGKQRIFVNCGTHPYSPEWQSALKSSAAHNTLQINELDSTEIFSDGRIGRSPINVNIEREALKNCEYINASHDGFMASHGATHIRKIALYNRGKLICGEDQISCLSAPSENNVASIRFHIHPSIRASFTSDKGEILLRLPGGTGFRFLADGAEMAIEDSIYLGDGFHPQKTAQIVLRAPLGQENTAVEWALKREELH